MYDNVPVAIPMASSKISYQSVRARRKISRQLLTGCRKSILFSNQVKTACTHFVCQDVYAGARKGGTSGANNLSQPLTHKYYFNISDRRNFHNNVFAYFFFRSVCRITRLTWVEVNLARSEILLDPARSKTDRPRTLPLSDPLRAVTRRRGAARRLDVRWVFHWNGRPIGDWHKRWNKARRAAGYPGKRLHDCRRTAARNLRQAGVPEDVAMKLTGHATRDVFRRYAIIVDDDLRSGVEQLASYVKTQPAKPTLQSLSRRGAR